MKWLLLPVHDPTDPGSVTTAISLCRDCGLQLKIIHVVEEHVGVPPVSELEELHNIVQAAGIECEVRISIGKPAKQILKSMHGETELVLLKHHSFIRAVGSGLLRLSDLSARELDPVGQVTREIVKRSAIPTIITFGRESELHRPLFACSGSTASVTGLRNVLQVAGDQLFRGGIALHVGKAGDRSDKIVGDARKLAREFGVILECQVVDGDPGAEIVDAVDRFGCDSIVVGSYGRNWFRRSIFGKTLEEIFSKTTVPVFLG